MSPSSADAIRFGTKTDDLTRMDAARELGISVKTLAKWAIEKKGPPFSKSNNGAALYPREALHRWRARQVITLRYSFAPEGAAA
jgi:hypothetical protein